MQFQALIVISFLVLTGSAQRCLKGNHANQFEKCEGVGNLICSHNYKHVVSNLTPIDTEAKLSAAMVNLVLITCVIAACLRQQQRMAAILQLWRTLPRWLVPLRLSTERPLFRGRGGSQDLHRLATSCKCARIKMVRNMYIIGECS